MTLGTQIAALRKEHNITQEALAQQLGVTNQAVSKWESDQCCPDITLLPKLADVFSVSLDTLFSRTAPTSQPKLPWEDDDTLHVALFRGRTLLTDRAACSRIDLHWHGPLAALDCALSVTCDDVEGNVSAGGSVTCDCVEGDVHAGGNVTCDNVEGNVRAGGNVNCDNVEGNVTAGCGVTCDNIEGNATAGWKIHCD